MALTKRQKELVKYLNQLSQNIVSGSNDASLNMPGIDVDLDVGIGGEGTGEDTAPTPPNNGVPQTMQDVLRNSLNETVQLTTPFGVVTGTLIDVEDDYVVLVEGNGDQTFVRTDKIEFVGEM